MSVHEEELALQACGRVEERNRCYLILGVEAALAHDLKLVLLLLVSSFHRTRLREWWGNMDLTDSLACVERAYQRSDPTKECVICPEGMALCCQTRMAAGVVNQCQT